MNKSLAFKCRLNERKTKHLSPEVDDDFINQITLDLYYIKGNEKLTRQESILKFVLYKFDQFILKKNQKSNKKKNLRNTN